MGAISWLFERLNYSRCLVLSRKVVFLWRAHLDNGESRNENMGRYSFYGRILVLNECCPTLSSGPVRRDYRRPTCARSRSSNLFARRSQRENECALIRAIGNSRKSRFHRSIACKTKVSSSRLCCRIRECRQIRCGASLSREQKVFYEQSLYSPRQLSMISLTSEPLPKSSTRSNRLACFNQTDPFSTSPAGLSTLRETTR